jgi:hypothetical protein
LAIDGFSQCKLHFAKIHSRSFAIMKMHQPTSPNKAFPGKSQLGSYSDSILEMDRNIGRSMDVIREVAPDTIVVRTRPADHSSARSPCFNCETRAPHLPGCGPRLHQRNAFTMNETFI